MELRPHAPSGAAATETIVIVSVIAVVVLLAVTLFGSRLVERSREATGRLDGPARVGEGAEPDLSGGPDGGGASGDGGGSSTAPSAGRGGPTAGARGPLSSGRLPTPADRPPTLGTNLPFRDAKGNPIFDGVLRRRQGGIELLPNRNENPVGPGGSFRERVREDVRRQVERERAVYRAANPDGPIYEPQRLAALDAFLAASDAEQPFGGGSASRGPSNTPNLTPEEEPLPRSRLEGEQGRRDLRGDFLRAEDAIRAAQAQLQKQGEVLLLYDDPASRRIQQGFSLAADNLFDNFSTLLPAEADAEADRQVDEYVFALFGDDALRPDSPGGGADGGAAGALAARTIESLAREGRELEDSGKGDEARTAYARAAFLLESAIRASRDANRVVGLDRPGVQAQRDAQLFEAFRRGSGRSGSELAERFAAPSEGNQDPLVRGFGQGVGRAAAAYEANLALQPPASPPEAPDFSKGLSPDGK